MPDRIQQTLDVIPCHICLGKFGQHAWRACPARCIDCNGYGHILGANHPAGHIDAHPQMYRDLLRDSICPTCQGSRALPRFQEELKVYRQQLERLLQAEAAQPLE